MTVSSTTRKAGPFAGNNLATTFPFNFKIFAKGDIKALLVSPNGLSTQLTLDSDYSVQVNANQDQSPGGWVTYPISGAPLAANYELVLLGDLAYDQETDLTNSGGFYPQTVEDMADRSTIQIQQLAEIASRAIVINEAESVSPVLPGASGRANTLVGFDALGNLKVYALTPAIGAGDLKDERFVDGIDYTSGVSNYITVSRNYGNKANLGAVVMQGVVQDPNSYSLDTSTNRVTFDSIIPAGVGVIWLKGGTTLSNYVPPDGSVGDDQLQWGAELTRVVASVSALVNLNPAKYQRARTNGYYSGGPGGADYYYDATFAQSGANGGSAIASAVGSGCWRLLPREIVSLFHFGAKGDDVADDTIPVKAAVAYCASLGIPLYAPTCAKAFRLTSEIDIPTNFVLYGDGVQPYVDNTNVTVSHTTIGFGSWFHIDHAGRGFSASGVTQAFSVTYRGIGTIRNQPTPNGAAAFTPNANDFDFYNSNADLFMDDVFCLNPTKFSYTTGGGRAIYRRVRGQPLTYGIYTDTAYDVCHYDYIHFWPWWSQAPGVYVWTQANGLAFISARNDNPQYSNIFTYAYKAGINVTSNANGNTSRLAVTNADFDFANYGVLVDGTCAGMTGMLTNLKATGYGASANHGVAINPGAVGCELRMENVHIANFGGDGVRVDGTSNLVWIGNAKVEAWNLSNVGFPAFYAAASCKITFNGALPYTAVPTGTPTVLGGAGLFGGLSYAGLTLQTTNGTGDIAIAHNLGAVPTSIFITLQTIGAPLTGQVVDGSSSATQFTVRFFTTSTGVPLATGSVKFNYLLKFE